MPIRVAIVEDDRALRGLLAEQMTSNPSFALAGAYEDCGGALNAMGSARPDVLLLDIRLGKSSGVDAIPALRKVAPQCQILMLTVDAKPETIFRALAAGAVGYLLKAVSPDEIAHAIFDIYRGGSPMSSQVARKVVQEFSRGRTVVKTSSPSLTKREHEVLMAATKGLRDKEIASELGISVHTVRNHFRNIYEKLQVKTRGEALYRVLH
ncbi:MAG: response regulator transcription factor [Verrucomicrobiota bacterium]